MFVFDTFQDEMPESYSQENPVSNSTIYSCRDEEEEYFKDLAYIHHSSNFEKLAHEKRKYIDLYFKHIMSSIVTDKLL